MTTNSLGNQSTSTSFTITTPSTTDSISSTTQHTVNSASSTAASILSVAGTSADDAYTSFSIGTTTQYSIGIDNSDSDSLKITYGTASTPTPSTASPRMVMTTEGNITKPLIPSFMAYNPANVANVTGDGTAYTIIPTEEFDVGGNFNAATGVFTAPIAGKYVFGMSGDMYNNNINHANSIFIATTAYVYSANFYKWYNLDTDLSNSCEVLANMAAGDTCSFACFSYNSTKTVGVQGAAAGSQTFVYGYLRF